MSSNIEEVSRNVPPFLQVLKDGTIRRLEATQVVPAGLDPETNVLSKDITNTIAPETGVSARLYRPNTAKNAPKLPLLIYYHGGAFLVESAYETRYHFSLNKLVAEADVIAVSVDYRLVPEHPLPAAYDDSWAALQWVGSHVKGGNGNEAWLKVYADFGRVFLMGDSAGANIAHHMAMRLKNSDVGSGLKVSGIGLIHPYFWGKDPIGTEKMDELRKQMVDNWWMFVCPSDKGCDDPYINPFADGAPSLEKLACDKVLVAVAEKDILRDRGRLYYENLVKSGWPGKAEIEETVDEDHVFHILNPNTDQAKGLIKHLASFIKG